MSKFDEIIKLLEKAGVSYQLAEHQPAVSTADAVRLTGWSADSSAKSILFKIDLGYVLCVVKGANTVDFSKLKAVLGTRKARLATAQEVKKVMGVDVGACYPFGEVAGVQSLVDNTLNHLIEVSFSAGTPRHHIRMLWKDYARLARPNLTDIIKD